MYILLCKWCWFRTIQLSRRVDIMHMHETTTVRESATQVYKWNPSWIMIFSCTNLTCKTKVYNHELALLQTYSKISWSLLKKPGIQWLQQIYKTVNGVVVCRSRRFRSSREPRKLMLRDLWLDTQAYYIDYRPMISDLLHATEVIIITGLVSFFQPVEQGARRLLNFDLRLARAHHVREVLLGNVTT